MRQKAESGGAPSERAARNCVVEIERMTLAKIKQQRADVGLIANPEYLAALDKQIKEIAGLEGEINALRERQKAVEALQANRNLPVHLLNELVRQLPEGVYISSIKQNGLQVEMKGVAQSNERVSEVLRNLSGNTAWFAKPDLKEIVASTVALSPKDQRKVVNFNLSFLLVLPVDAESGAAAVATGGAKP